MTPINPHSYVDTAGSGIVSYSITLNYRGFVDSYEIKTKHFIEIFGLTGGLIAFIYFIAFILG